MDKKGFVRTLEAVIAILLLLGLVLYILPEKEAPTGEVPAAVELAQQYVLNEVALNKVHRDCVLRTYAGYEGKCESGCLGTLKQFVEQQAPVGFTAACEVCDSALSCATFNFPLDKSVYTDSIFLTRDQTSKILRVYFYER